MEQALRERVERWMETDPDPGDRDELRRLLVAGDTDELSARFAGSLEFGTAGLRAPLGAGPLRMNRAVVARATAGLCAHMHATLPAARQRGVCIGFDGRHRSRKLAEEVAAVANGAGFKVCLFSEVVPTPLLAFSILDQQAAAGVMITASHNPPEYNGYKVYWENGAQIIPPHDKAILQAIEEAPGANALPRVQEARAMQRGLRVVLSEEVEERYLAGIRRLVPHSRAQASLDIAYTALHGVGEPLIRAALADHGSGRVHCVASQGHPDPDFPTVTFPNPEEPGAMDHVLQLADEHDAELVLANDPDADRLAVAARDADGSMTMLNGNEIGVLLAHYLLLHGNVQRARLVVSTVVSSPLLGEIAREHGARWETTLTGFKWIANRALELERTEGLEYVFGYEEALGYGTGALVRDKDGISAALVMADLAAWAKARGSSVWGELEALYRRHGVYASRQVSHWLEGPGGAQRATDLMETLRRDPPTTVAGKRVRERLDLWRRERVDADGRVSSLAMPKTQAVVLELEGGHRIAVRPSGTEPKLKLYVDVREALAEQEGLRQARERAEATMASLVAAMQAVLGLAHGGVSDSTGSA